MKGFMKTCLNKLHHHMALSYKSKLIKLLDSGVIVSTSIISKTAESTWNCPQDFAMDCNDEASQQHEPDKLKDGTLPEQVIDVIPDDVLIEASQQYESDCLPVIEKGHDEQLTDEILIEASQQYEKSCEQLDDEGEIDSLLLMASQQFEAKTSRFGSPINNINEALEKVRESGVPQKTKESTAWGLNVWKAWAKQRNSIAFVDEIERSHVLEENFEDMTIDAMSVWLPKFIIEARKQNGESYAPETVYSLCCALQRSLKACDKVDINIFTDQRFKKFSQILDAEMKTLKATGKYEKNLQTS